MLRPDGIDAETLARIPLAGPRGLQRLELPGTGAAALDRRARACDWLTRAVTEHKVRIKDLVRQLIPMTPLTGDIGKSRSPERRCRLAGATLSQLLLMSPRPYMTGTRSASANGLCSRSASGDLACSRSN